MDPVNKWLSLIALFMIALIFAIAKVGGEGRWQMEVMPYSSSHDMVYVLDTKTGEVKAKLHAMDKHLKEDSDGQTYASPAWKTVRKVGGKSSYYNKAYERNPITFPTR